MIVALFVEGEEGCQYRYGCEYFVKVRLQAVIHDRWRPADYDGRSDTGKPALSIVLLGDGRWRCLLGTGLHVTEIQDKRCWADTAEGINHSLLVSAMTGHTVFEAYSD